MRLYLDGEKHKSNVPAQVTIDANIGTEKLEQIPKNVRD